MIDLLLSRIYTNKEGTFGTLSWKGQAPFALTLEPEWYNNTPYVSCIPAGTYICRRINSPKYSNTFEITNVQGRTEILFHWGNLEKNTEGCVLIGEEFGNLGSQPGVLSSKRGFKEFLRLTEGLDSFTLAIRDFWT